MSEAFLSGGTAGVKYSLFHISSIYANGSANVQIPSDGFFIVSAKVHTGLYQTFAIIKNNEFIDKDEGAGAPTLTISNGSLICKNSQGQPAFISVIEVK